ncbi:MAG: bifunctional enoyl-CoA hydratase/phosphate acetyltransferase [Acholeplasmataceae bacterium]
MLKTINDLLAKAKEGEQKTLVVACADDKHVLDAVEKARAEGIIRPILVGNKEIILMLLDDLTIDPKYFEIIDIMDHEQACDYAVKLVSENDGYALMKGYVDTKVILKSVLKEEFGFKGKNRLSHVSLFEIKNYHKLLLMSDGAMNMYPGVDEKQEIIENAVKVLHHLGIQNPKVGVIAAIEKLNEKMPPTVDAVELIKRNQEGKITGCMIDGPFALDNAINKEAAIHKGIDSEVAGDVDMILMPQIESGNVFYKSMMFLADAKSASIIVGGKRPIVLTSRADSTESKFYSIALAAMAV